MGLEEGDFGPLAKLDNHSRLTVYGGMASEFISCLIHVASNRPESFTLLCSNLGQQVHQPGWQWLHDRAASGHGTAALGPGIQNVFRIRSWLLYTALSYVLLPHDLNVDVC